jgi:hypothetical protein
MDRAGCESVRVVHCVGVILFLGGGRNLRVVQSLCLTKLVGYSTV